MYENGLGVEANRTRALNWYTRAAEAGHAAARVQLEVLLADQPGRGQPDPATPLAPVAPPPAPEPVQAAAAAPAAPEREPAQAPGPAPPAAPPAAPVPQLLAVEVNADALPPAALRPAAPLVIGEALELAALPAPVVLRPPVLSPPVAEAAQAEEVAVVLGPPALDLLAAEAARAEEAAVVLGPPALDLLAAEAARAEEGAVVLGPLALGPPALDLMAAEAARAEEVAVVLGPPALGPPVGEIVALVPAPVPPPSGLPPGGPAVEEVAEAVVGSDADPPPVIVVPDTLAGIEVAENPGLEGLIAYRRGDYLTALANLLPAAVQGDTTAQFLLGGMYRDGAGIPPDTAQAHLWWTLASTGGHAEAALFLAELRRGLDPASLAEAERLLANWSARP